MADKKSRTKLSVEDKMAIFAYKEEHPNTSFSKLAEIFTEKLNKKIHKSMALKNYNKIKKRKEEGSEFNQAAMMTKSIKIEIQLCMLTNFYWQLPLNRGKICIILVDIPYKVRHSL